MPIADRLIRNRVIVGECWLWTGWRLPSGYGTMRIRRERRTALVHRVAYEVWIGPIPEGMQVLHRCDTPPCFNPSHLWIGTQRDNIHDMLAKGRDAKQKPLKRWRGYKLTEAQALEAIERRDGGERADSVARAFGITPGYVRMLAKTRPSRHLGHARACEYEKVTDVTEVRLVTAADATPPAGMPQ